MDNFEVLFVPVWITLKCNLYQYEKLGRRWNPWQLADWFRLRWSSPFFVQLWGMEPETKPNLQLLAQALAPGESGWCDDGEQPIQCQVCGKKFTLQRNLYQHERRKHGATCVPRRRNQGDQPFMCQVEGCGKKFYHTKNLYQHERQKHGAGLRKPWTHRKSLQEEAPGSFASITLATLKTPEQDAPSQAEAPEGLE